MPLSEQKRELYQRIVACDNCATRNVSAILAPEPGVIIAYRGRTLGHWQCNARMGFQFHTLDIPNPTHIARDINEAHAMTVGIAAMNLWR
jgi:hypothetical protein